MPASTPALLLPALARLVVKDGVGLGGLSLVDRDLGLGVAWAALPHTPTTEAGINQRLQQVLAGPACWLHTDHVELRRWLVDAGWLARDGFGHTYERVSLARLPASVQALGDSLSGLDVTPWVAQTRQRHHDERAARHQAWRQQA